MYITYLADLPIIKAFIQGVSFFLRNFTLFFREYNFDLPLQSPQHRRVVQWFIYQISRERNNVTDSVASFKGLLPCRLRRFEST